MRESEFEDLERQRKLDSALAEFRRRLAEGESKDTISARLVATNPDLEQDILDWIQSFESCGINQAAPCQERSTDDYSSPHNANLSPGDKVGQYTIIRTVCKGEIGVVYVAKEEVTGRQVALKILSSSADEGFQKRFEAEYKHLTENDHPHIIGVLSVGTHANRPYFTMLFLPKGSLQQKHNLEQYTSAPNRAAAVMVKVARAVQHAHSRFIIHRDLKPSNVLLDDHGEPQVADFGLAKRTDTSASLTSPGEPIGTPAYMSPEQATGTDSRDVRLDIYGLGATFYELLTGQPPYGGTTKFEVIAQVKDMNKDPASPHGLNSIVPRDLATICMKCLEKDPAKRYKSAEDLAKDLERFLAGEPIIARPTPRWERTLKWCRRKPAAAAAIFSGVAAIIVLTVAYVVVSSARNEAVAAEKATDRQRLIAVKLANDNEILANNALKDKAEIDERRKKAETLLVQLKFEDAFRQSGSRSDLSLLSTADLLREPVLIDNRLLQNSLRLHLGAWGGQIHQLRYVLDHGPDIRVAAFSPTGDRIVSGGDKVARLWDTATGNQIGSPLEHDDTVVAAAFSPNGKFVLTGSDDKTAKLWDAMTGKQIGTPFQHEDSVVAVAFSPNGKIMVTCGGSRCASSGYIEELRKSRDRTARFWDTATGKSLMPPLEHQGSVLAAAFSPDSETILIGGGDAKAQLWDVKTGKPIGQPLKHQDSIVAVAFSPDGKSVMTASVDMTACLWEREGSKLIGRQLQHRDRVVAVAFSPDSKTAITASMDKTARLWDTGTSNPSGPVLQHQEMVTSVAFSRDGKAVLTGSVDRTARVWDVGTSRLVGAPLQHDGPVWAVAFSPDGRSMLSAGWDKAARVWERAMGPSLGAALQHQNVVTAVAFSPDSKTMVTGSHTTTTMWDTSSGQQVGPTLLHQHSVRAIVFSPDGKNLLTGSFDGKAQLWDPATGKPNGRAFEHHDAIVAVAFSRDGKTIATGSFDKTARLWDTDTRQPIGLPQKHQGYVVSLAFSPDGKTVMTGSLDGTARLWDTATAKEVGPPLQHKSDVKVVAFSPDGKTLLTASNDETAQLWSTATREKIGPPMQHRGSVLAAAFSPDSKMVLTGSSDATARLWNAKTGAPISAPLQHQNMIVAVGISPDSRILVTASHDKMAQLWEAATGKPIGQPLQHDDRLMTVAFCPNGSCVLTASTDRTARLWRVPNQVEGEPERILVWAQVITGMELDEHARPRVMEASTWAQRHKRLLELGGPP